MKRLAIDLNDVIRDYTGQFIKCFQKGIDPTFDVLPNEVDSFDFATFFPFSDKDEYASFRFEDYAFEIFARAEAMDKMLPAKFNMWTQNTLRNLDADKVPEVLLVSPFEANMTIQATFSFLSKIATRVREIYFPMDSMTIWDRCDILITANPNLIANVPEGKTVIKINMPYNKEVEAEYSFDSLMDIIDDKNETILDLIEKDE